MDNTLSDCMGCQSHSDFVPNQYPACLLPDGSWRFGKNARRIADAAWSWRREGLARLSHPPHQATRFASPTLEVVQDSRPDDVLDRMFRAILRYAKAFWERQRSRSELELLGSQERTHVARDLGMPADTLRILASQDENSADLLVRRMRTIRLEPSVVPVATMRDLQRCCSTCSVKVLCTHELEDHPRDPAWPRYCPNEHTLAALGSEKDARLFA